MGEIRLVNRLAKLGAPASMLLDKKKERKEPLLMPGRAQQLKSRVQWQ
jgi:hypothetical protein